MSRELELRNQMIYEAHCAGKSIQDLALQYNLTRQRISQIITGFQPQGTDDQERALERARMNYIEDTLLGIISGGPHPMFNVKGGINIDMNGEPVMDWTQVNQAIDSYRKISAEKRRMDALDQPRRKQMIEDEARKQAEDWIRQFDLRTGRDESSVVLEGEVLRDDISDTDG